MNLCTGVWIGSSSSSTSSSSVGSLGPSWVSSCSSSYGGLTANKPMKKDKRYKGKRFKKKAPKKTEKFREKEWMRETRSIKREDEES